MLSVTTLLPIFERILYICISSIFSSTIKKMFMRVQESDTCSLSVGICSYSLENDPYVFEQKLNWHFIRTKNVFSIIIIAYIILR